MRIEITRSGGFGGLTRTWSLEVSRTEAEQRWLPLAQAEAEGSTGAQGASQSGQSSTERDRFTYRIAIGYTELHLPESRLEDPWRELIERARTAAEDADRPPAPGDGRGTAT